MQKREYIVVEQAIPERFHSRDYLDVLDTSQTTKRLCLIQNAATQVMLSSAEDHYPDEACGLLLGILTDQGWRIEETRAVRNLNTDRAADRFILDPAAYQSVDRELRGSGRGREIIGIYHSHPDCPAKPSPTDLTNAWEGFAYIIVSTYEGHAIDTQCWTLNNTGDKFQSVAIPCNSGET